MILSKSKIQSINLDQLINNHIQQNRLDELLIIVPTNRKIRYLKRELISLSPNKAVTKLNLYTLGTFSTKIFQSNNFATTNVLSDASAAVLLNKSFKETGLKYFSNYRGEIPRGTLDRIKNVISEYKRNGIVPEKIFSESENLYGSEKLKAQDIAGIYLNYLSNCKKLNAYEIGDIYAAINDLSKKDFAEKFQQQFAGVKRIIINGFDEFTKPEIEIINNASNVSNIELFVVFDYYRFNPALFTHLDSCYEKLTEKGFSEIQDNSSIVSKLSTEGSREIFYWMKRFGANSEIKYQNNCRFSAEEVRLIAKNKAFDI